jgi:dihydrofolate reductase
MGKGRVIGRENRLPWHLPADLAHFKQVTMGKPIVMGRKTWESIGRPLPGRDNIVISRQQQDVAGVICVPTLESVWHMDYPEVMIIGGASIYQQALARADKLELTLIDGEFDGDAYFPAFSSDDWHEHARRHRPADAANPYAMDFVTLVRTPH